MRDPAFIAKATKRPLALLTLAPGSAPTMGPSLALWFVYCLVVSTCTALLVWQIVGPGGSPMLASNRCSTASFTASSPAPRSRGCGPM